MDTVSRSPTSPAIDVLTGLIRDGFHIALTPDGALVIAPKSKLTSARMQSIADCRDALKRLIATDAGVAERRARFRQQFVAAPIGTVPVFLFRVGVSYQRGICFSCGAGLTTHQFGRCWRCALAWRLAADVPLAPTLAAALDTAKVSG